MPIGEWGGNHPNRTEPKIKSNIDDRVPHSGHVGHRTAPQRPDRRDLATGAFSLHKKGVSVGFDTILERVGGRAEVLNGVLAGRGGAGPGLSWTFPGLSKGGGPVGRFPSLRLDVALVDGIPVDGAGCYQRVQDLVVLDAGDDGAGGLAGEPGQQPGIPLGPGRVRRSAVKDISAAM